MIFYPADKMSLILFSIFCVLMCLAVTSFVWRARYKPKKFLLLFSSYLIVFCGVVQSGLPIRFFVPFGPILFLSVLIGALVFALSEYGQKISATNSLALLIGFQGFRFPLELLLHHWVEIGTIPPTMTWSGQNWDIVTGLISLIGIPFVNKSKWIAWCVQVTGFILLLNVLRVVIMSSPLPFAWPLDNPILLIAYLPYALIGPLFVGVALAWHIITFRKLSS